MGNLMTDLVTVRTLREMKAEGRKIACLTCYDAAFAKLLNAAQVDLLLVGDSLGMVLQGHRTTHPVTVRQMAYHTELVARGSSRAFLLADLPFMAYADEKAALRNAARLIRAGAHGVKLEGGDSQLPKVTRLSAEGIVVCAHLGLLPQSVHKLGGYLLQGRHSKEADKIQFDAENLQQAGASMLVLESVPAPLAALIARNLDIPVIGIGAGMDCDGQVLVLYDLIGLGDRRPRFAADFLRSGGSLAGAVRDYVDAVRGGRFPGPEHSYG